LNIHSFLLHAPPPSLKGHKDEGWSIHRSNPILQDSAQYQANHEKRRGCRYFYQVLLNKRCVSGHKAGYVYGGNDCGCNNILIQGILLGFEPSCKWILWFEVQLPNFLSRYNRKCHEAIVLLRGSSSIRP
jgi:hypothetical protein